MPPLDLWNVVVLICLLTLFGRIFWWVLWLLSEPDPTEDKRS